ncbi:MAG TPA: tetratricopeptide repeat protein, partial [Candidatus Acidoferrum sp.]|nr:tetratricopeptide repeat protein [Candidatus Acidoferrum sp.]
EQALRNAKAVVVLWSKRSVESRWVRAEATLADRNKTLVPVMIEACERPIMFELTQTADLCHWQGDHGDKAWQSFLADVHQFTNRNQAGAAASGKATPVVALPKAAVETSPSIAVLPFANLSGDKEQEYFSDGLAEEIINALAQLPQLKVIARTSAFAFKGQNLDVRKIADTLGVSHVLEGSVRRAGNRIRVTAQLIIAKDGSHLWSERFDRELADVFAVQDEIATAIAGALKVKLSAAAEAKARYTPKLEAWEALLKARHLHWKVTMESMEQARTFYEQSIALDPQFAQAYAEYSDYLYGRTTIALSSLRDIVHQSRAMAHKALALDPALSEPLTTLCYAACMHDHDWAEAHRLFELIKAAPYLSSITWMGIGWSYNLSAGRLEDAVACLHKAVQTDPLQQTCRAVLARCLTAAGRYDEAEAVLLQSLALEPDFFWSHSYLADLEVTRGRIAEALPYSEKAVALAPWDPQSVGALAGILVRLGRPEQATAVMQKLGREQTYGVPLGHAVFHTLCNELDTAADWFGKAIEQRDCHALACLQGGIGKPMRSSTHWSKLMQMANLPG